MIVVSIDARFVMGKPAQKRWTMNLQTYKSSDSNTASLLHNNDIRCLIVDDDPVIEQTLTPLLRDAFDNIDVLNVATTFEAIKHAYEFKPTLVLVETKVNKALGINLIPIFKNNLPGVICIVLTSSRDADIAAHAIHYGADDYILKPIDASYLIEIINEKILMNSEEKRRINNDTMLHTLFKQCANMLLIMDRTGLIIDVNDTLLEMTGYAKEELVGRNLVSTNMWSSDPRTQKKIRNRLIKATNGLFVRDEIGISCSDRKISIVDFSIKPITDDKGVVEFILFEAREINMYKRNERKLYQLAHFDHLTQLPNRVLFNDRLAQSIRGAKRFNRVMAVLFIDIDNFKEINDTHGHEAGDAILQVTASKIRRCIREIDTVSRLGGDEFAVILSEVKSQDTTIDTARRIIDVVSRPVVYNDAEITITVSIGIALFPEDASSVSGLLSLADSAMYQAKQAGKNNYVFYRELEHQH